MPKTFNHISWDDRKLPKLHRDEWKMGGREGVGGREAGEGLGGNEGGREVVREGGREGGRGREGGLD